MDSIETFKENHIKNLTNLQTYCRNWIDNQELGWEHIEQLDLKVDNLWYSYQNTKNADAKPLTQFKRIFIYDVALAFYAQILEDKKNKNFSKSKKIYAKIAELLNKEYENGLIGLGHFSYNTSPGSYIDPYIITGSNLWLFKSLFAYMLHSGDIKNWDVLIKYITNFIFPLQITEENHPCRGLIKAGYKNHCTKHNNIYKNIKDYNPLKTPVPLIVFEHNSSFVDLLRLMQTVIDNHNIETPLTDALKTRHKMLTSALIKYSEENKGNIYWPSAINLLDNKKHSVNNCRAVDHYTWLASTFLSTDENIPWKAIKVLIEDFRTTINSIEIKEINEIKNIPLENNKKAVGLSFFPCNYEDYFVHIPGNERNKLSQMIQPEATCGAIIFLNQFVNITKNNDRKNIASIFLEELIEGMFSICENFKNIYSGRIMGMPYATKNITNYFNSLPSMASTATFYIALECLKSNYQYFIGVPLPEQWKNTETNEYYAHQLAHSGK